MRIFSRSGKDRRKPSPSRRIALAAAALLLLCCFAGALLLDHLKASAPILELSPQGTVRTDSSIIFLSGDLGIPKRLSLGGGIAHRLAENGYLVTAISSPAAFSERKSQAEVTHLLTEAMRVASARNPDAPIVLIGQSFGADMIPIALDGMPPALERKISKIILIVPGTKAYLQVSALEMAGIAPPDLSVAPLARELPAVPIVCIYGVKEADSLCPVFADNPSATAIGMPGGHQLNRDTKAVYAVVSRALRPSPAA